MSFCFGFASSDPSLTECALEPFADVLLIPDGAPHGWGMGYYQVGQPLMRKQPKTPPGPVDFGEVASNLRTSLVIGHVRDATVGGQRTENTHPFRYRQWMFCHSGTIDRFAQVQDEVLQSIPDFIRRNIRGETDSEHLFHLFLSFLNDTGRLDDPRVGAKSVAEALVSTFAFVDRLGRDRGGAPSDACAVLSNGNILAVLRRGMPVKLSRHSQYICTEADGREVPKPKLRAVLIVGGRVPEAQGWEEVADRSVVSVDAQLNIESLPLS